MGGESSKAFLLRKKMWEIIVHISIAIFTAHRLSSKGPWGVFIFMYLYICIFFWLICCIKMLWPWMLCNFHVIVPGCVSMRVSACTLSSMTILKMGVFTPQRLRNPLLRFCMTSNIVMNMFGFVCYASWTTVLWIRPSTTLALHVDWSWALRLFQQ